MAGVKPDNRHLAILTGYGRRWHHNTATTTYAPRSGEPVVLHSVTVNTTTASAVILVDTATGVIGSLKASVAEGTYQYQVRCRGSLRVENSGGSDLTVTFSNN